MRQNPSAESRQIKKGRDEFCHQNFFAASRRSFFETSPDARQAIIVSQDAAKLARNRLAMREEIRSGQFGDVAGSLTRATTAADYAIASECEPQDRPGKEMLTLNQSLSVSGDKEWRNHERTGINHVESEGLSAKQFG